MTIMLCSLRAFPRRNYFLCYRVSIPQYRPITSLKTTSRTNKASCTHESLKPKPIGFSLAHRTVREKNTNAKSFQNWSIGKKVLTLYFGAVALIVFVLLLDWNINDNERQASARRRKIERAKGEDGLFKYFISIPGMRNSILLSFVGGFTAWTLTFLLTSTPRKAYTVGYFSTFLAFITYFLYCYVSAAEDRQDREKLADVYEEVRKKRASLVMGLAEDPNETEEE
ncbi:uncharacterized protein [Watersipora subatra]|uniref:uncharacterized protein n=1 Tax=Watersipora subatra TaxID=2589382 RepID=UPI00355B88FE